ncbi:patatin-like phospholipase RssA [Flavobacterium sp. MXW15]|uniref:Patatin-like phospholipase RssA n=1 Tax=Xanthomonas chitinilytica TaxID=2989819 RepID=A0ABT3JX05_9XANT|nr:patatin-like phospholipase RssA [Xanthomonas sp. H13-6]MCW4455812.1 patatin-like phospholipase RssA [Flavobacterium sp. MXW15]MCW4473027.1 patatin-like phospholipase RssA [Xanthomonas sp. H13-6]
MDTPCKPRIGLALGGGSARGWAHIGVISALEENGIRPDVIAGTSIGALVGAVHAGGQLGPFEDWVRTLTPRDVMSLMDFQFGGGVLKGVRLMDFLRNRFNDAQIEDLAIPFAATATVLQTGAEVWLRSGSAIDAVRASIALPALFTPVHHEGRLLVDGGLVNPVPVSLARAMEADIVIAVDLASGLLGRNLRPSEAKPAEPGGHEWLRRLQASVGGLLSSSARTEPSLPSLLSVVSTSIDIMQVRITRSRMAGDPPEVLLRPQVADIGLLDFHRAAEGIEAGRRAVEVDLPSLKLHCAAATADG